SKVFAAAGEDVQVIATPASGKRLKAGTLKYTASLVETVMSGTSFTMPSGDVTVTAQFEDVPPTVYSITVGSDIIGGTVQVDKVSAATGEDVQVIATPASNKRLKAGTLKYTAGLVETVMSGTSFTMPSSDVVVTAEFEDVPPTVSITSISVSGAGGINAITSQGGALQMQATVLPAVANGQVTWSVREADGVTETDKATITSSGLLTAEQDGVVKVVASATDGSGMQGSSYVVIRGQTPVQTDVPHTTLMGAAAVQAGASFSTNFGLTNVTNSVSSSVYAADILLSFDANAVEFVSVDALKSGFAVVETKKDVPGQIRIIAVSEGEAGAITASGDVFKINWKAKPLASSTTTNLALTKAALSNALGQKMDAPLANLTLSVTAAVAVDKTTLQTVLGLAQSIYDRTVEGTQAGQFAAGSKAVLLAAIQTAAAVGANPAVTQQQLANAANALNQAIQTFNQQIITVFSPGDVNGDYVIDIGDLGKTAAQYGKTTASSDWNAAKDCDFNHDGKIDIIDVVSIAKLIMQ
ncbi:InlB B-repeat-containing protein, partial [Paenibacillus planticolens]|uniref:InlB B-repeat-containing protein n=1 Tax=Paenibacillus planticolens TaxID=2654976 RepID=UPI001FEBB069